MADADETGRFAYEQLCLKYARPAMARRDMAYLQDLDREGARPNVVDVEFPFNDAQPGTPRIGRSRFARSTSSPRATPRGHAAFCGKIRAELAACRQ